MAAMKDSHRIFMQSFMSKGILSGSEVKEFHKLACEKFDETPENLVDFVKTINHNIKAYHLEIKKAIGEDVEAKQYYALVQTAESDITRMASEFSVNELEFFKKIVEQIVESETGRMSSVEALNLTDSLEKKMSKKEAQDLMERLEQNHWLRKCPSGEICLSTRAIVELDQYIIEQFPESAVKCEMCRRLCLQGQNCQQCDVRIHLNCAARTFRDQTNPKCPAVGCQAAWDQEIPVLAQRHRGPSQASQPEPSASEDHRRTSSRSSRR